MTVRRINPRAKQARRVGQVMVKSLHVHLEGQGEHLSGFAMVSWDARGAVQTSFMCSSGPVSRCLVGTFVGNVLTQHVAASMAQECGVEVIPPDDSA